MDGTNRELELVQRKEELKSMLVDPNWAFTADELDAIIHNEFFNDANPLDTQLVDLAVTRMLLLKGIQPSATILQNEREKIITAVLQELLIFNKQ